MNKIKVVLTSVLVVVALLVLLQVPELLTRHLVILETKTSNELLRMLVPMGYMLVIGSKIMTANLILHLLLRGYWIGLIGLHSAYPNGIQFDRLPFSSRFIRFLSSRVRDLDASAVLVDKICSVIFAFTFLMIFIFVSVGLFFIVLFVLLSAI